MLTAEHLYGILTKYAESQGIQLNRDYEFVLDVISGLLKNEGRYKYRSCPCRLATGIKERDEDIICPCRYRDADIEEFGSCYCSLYVSRNWNEQKAPRVPIPERRPLRR